MSSSIIVLGIVFIGVYLLSSIPYGLLITRLMGLGDLKKISSGNIGATNVLRTGSKTAAALTLILDAGKGAVAVMITMMVTTSFAYSAAAAVLAVIAHCFPVWLGFKGGKGVSTGIGVTMVLSPVAGLGMIISWLVMAALFRLSSLAAIAAFIITPFLIYYSADETAKLPYTIATILIALLSIWQHRSNISRLISGSEPRIGTS